MHSVVRGIRLTILMSGTLKVFETGCLKRVFVFVFICQETTVAQIVGV